MKIAVVGSRDMVNQSVVDHVLYEYVQPLYDVIVSGGAKGVDTLAETFAEQHCQMKPIIFPAEWELYGRSAGFKRNKLIINECDICIAFWDGKSKGTKSSIDLSKKMNKPVYVYDFDGILVNGNKEPIHIW